MRFQKKVTEECRELLLRQLERYESEMEMTKEERKELHKWVSKGNSPYDNGDYIYSDNGFPMDFVNAGRFVDEQIEWFKNLSNEERDKFLREERGEYATEQDIPVIMAGNYCYNTDDELPFS
jgi:hypothetical protein